MVIFGVILALSTTLAITIIILIGVVLSRRRWKKHAEHMFRIHEKHMAIHKNNQTTIANYKSILAKGVVMN